MSISGNLGHVPQRGASGNQGVNSLVAKHLKSPEFNSVLNALNISPKNVKSLLAHAGVQTTFKFQEMQAIKINQDVSTMLKELGIISNAEVALVLESQDEIKKIRKRLKEINHSMYDTKQIKELLNALGLSMDDDAFYIADKAGGLLIIKNFVKELKED